MKKFNNVATILFTVLFASFIMNCGGADTNETDNEDTSDADMTETMDEDILAEDENVSDTDIITDIATLEYPEIGETNGASGDIISNLIFFDELDRERALAEWFKSNNPDSKLIWLVVSTYDCPYCVVEKRDLPKMNKQEYKDRGFSLVVVMNGLLSGPQVSLEPEKIAKLKSSNLEAYGEGADYVYGYLKSQALLTSLGLEGYPHNVLIDAEKMEILDVFGGWDTSLVDHYDGFIDFMLDEL
jgi:thioredoxin-related protein